MSADTSTTQVADSPVAPLPTTENKPTETEAKSLDTPAPVHVSLSIPHADTPTAQVTDSLVTPLPTTENKPTETEAKSLDTPAPVHVSLSIPHADTSTTQVADSPVTPLPTTENKPTETEGKSKGILPKISFLAMQKKKDENTAEVKAKKESDARTEASNAPVIKEKPAELFSNYKPSFDGRAKKFFQQLRTLNLKPKTRTSLIIGLVIGTIGFISYLFIFHSDKHSLKIYKNSLIEAFEKKEVPPTPKNSDIKTEDGNLQPSQNTGDINGENSVSNNTGNILDRDLGNSNTGALEDNSKKKELDKLRNDKIRAYFLK